MSSASLVLASEKVGYRTVEPPCPYFGACGGGALQDLEYEHQAALKWSRIQRQLALLEPLPAVEWIPADDPWRYRNKAELTFSDRDGPLALGYHAARSYWRVIDLEDCLLLPESVLRVARTIRELAAATGLGAYHPNTRRGFFRHLVIRHSRTTGRLLAALITGPGTRDVPDRVLEQAMTRHPELAGAYWGISDKLADVAVPQDLVHLRGAALLDDCVGPFQVSLQPFSFLQPNTRQAERMYERLLQAVRDRQAGVGWDLYCGVGLIACYLARVVPKVYAIDCEPHHLDQARRNASANGLTQIDFRLGRVEDLLMDRRFWLVEAKPDVVIVDPPRAGLHPRALASLTAAKPQWLAYLSCNVQAFVRDAGQLRDGYPRYRLTELTAFDMFPQTGHVEVLGIFERALR